MHSRFLGILLLCTVCCGGCSISPGASFGLFSEQERMIPEAKALRVPFGADLPRELNKTLHQPYIIEPGDGLLILPADLDSPVRVPSDQTVLPDGTIDLGKYGKPRVAGFPVAEIESIINRMIAAETKDAGFIDVRLVNRQSKLYYVLGEVNNPGKYPIVGNETALDGILTAGGLNRNASWKKIILVRPDSAGCGGVFGVDYPRIVQLGDTSTNYQLMPGDRIYVPSRSFWESLNCK